MKQQTVLKKRIYRWYNSSIRNEWINSKTIAVYLRKSFRLIDGNHINAIDIANVTVFFKYQNQGYFKSLILFLETLGNIYVESVLNDELALALLKNGYIEVSSGNYLKMFDNKLN